MLRILLIFLAFTHAAAAETLTAKRLIRAQTVLSADDIDTRPDGPETALTDPSEAIGREARITIYAGHPLRPEDLGPPTLVDRNQRVTLLYRSGALTISAEGRALARGGAGDEIRVMNTATKTTVVATISETGDAIVQPR